MEGAFWTTSLKWIRRWGFNDTLRFPSYTRNSDGTNWIFRSMGFLHRQVENMILVQLSRSSCDYQMVFAYIFNWLSCAQLSNKYWGALVTRTFFVYIGGLLHNSRMIIKKLSQFGGDFRIYLQLMNLYTIHRRSSRISLID